MFQLGITIIEVLISVVIFSLILLIIINIPQSLKLISGSQHQALAKDIIIQEIDRLRAQTYDNLAIGNGSIIDSRLSSLPFVSSQETISTCPPTVCQPGELTKAVDLKISWMEPNNKVSTVEVVTLIGKGGLP